METMRESPRLNTQVRARQDAMEEKSTKVDLKGVGIRYGDQSAVKDVDLSVYRKLITAIIGPSGCGKSTLLRAINRMNDSISGVVTEGQGLLAGREISPPGPEGIWRNGGSEHCGRPPCGTR